jgi:hypothetical protein
MSERDVVSRPSAGPRPSSPARSASRGRHPLERPGLVFLFAASIALVTYVLYRALPYFLSPLEARPHLAADAAFRPSGSWGHGLGVLGALVVAATLLYPLRKSWKLLRRFGRIAPWLRYHIWCGLAGPAFVTLHTAFKFGGLVAVSYWSMVAVMISGIIGRYIYAQIPRSIAGQEMSDRELAERDRELVATLQRDLASDPDLLGEMEVLSGLPGIGKARGVRLLVLSVLQDIEREWRTHLLRRHLRATGHYSAPLAREIAALARRRGLLRRRIAVLHVSRNIFRHWHRIHRPFAYVMFVVAVVHVAVALALGYTWSPR